MSGTPWMKFYPTDWRSEKTLRLVSRAARSLWIDMLGLIHEAGTGRLEINGKSPSEKDLATLLGDNPRTIRKLMSELESAGVFSRDQEQFVISRRIIRDLQKAERDRLNGRKGGNPALHNNDLGQTRVNPEDKAQKSEARSQKPEGSVSYETGSEALPDCREILFGKVKTYLINVHRMSDRNARSFIGRCLKQTGDDAGVLVDLFRDAAKERPAQIESWIMARLRPVERTETHKRTVDEIIAAANLYGDRPQ